MTDAYTDFLQSKFKFTKCDGFDVGAAEITATLHGQPVKPHQADIVRWALLRGRAAIFAKFGLGKTFMQLEIMRQIQNREGGRQLIVMPLGVRQEFFRDAASMGIAPTFIRRTEGIGGDGLYLTNYESARDGKIDVSLFNAVSLDEASVLRGYGTKTYQEFLPLFGDTKYKFVATATPSPNRYKELIHYAGFLGVMDTGQALTRFFQRDPQEAGNLTLYPHMEREFYTWLHSWAIFLQRPSDLGYSDEGYDLPPLDVRYHEIPAVTLIGKFDRDGQGNLIKEAALGLSDAAAEKREGLTARVAKMKEIVDADPESHFILWHDLEDERHAINKALPGCKDVFGAQDMDEREAAIIDFSEGRFRLLSTKPEIAGQGCNFQRHCHKAIFVGIGYKFNDFIQACHRILRFQQQHQVEIHLIYTETEREILAELQRKWADHDKLADEMSAIIREHGLSTTGLEAELSRTIGIARRVETGKLFEVAHNDCVDETRRMAENSIDLIHTSIPFGNHYEYSESFNDFGHNADNAGFFRQMDFLTPELLRVLKPGRVAAIHTKDRIRFGNVTGYGAPSVEPFHADCIKHYQAHGFIYFGMITVVTDVVRENNQTYRLSYSEMLKDSTKMGVGCPEYILLFRKLQTDRSKGYADVPVVKSRDDYSLGRWQVDAHGFWRSSGNRFLCADEMLGYGADAMNRVFEEHSLKRIYDFREHVKLAEGLDEKKSLPRTYMSIAPASHHPDVWHDVTRMRTLNGQQSQKGLANHICPLQFDIVDRIIERYSNKGDVVFDPFGGLMTVPVRAIMLGRRGRAAELNADYFRDGVRYLAQAELDAQTPTLFDFEFPKEVA